MFTILKNIILFTILLGGISSELASISSIELETFLKKKNHRKILAKICPLAVEGQTCSQKFTAQITSNNPVNTLLSESPDNQKYNINNEFILDIKKLTDPDFIEYIMTEINIGIKIAEAEKTQKLNLMPIVDCCSEIKQVLLKQELTVYIRTQYFAQGNLRNFIKQHKKSLPFEWKLSICHGISLGLRALNVADYAHRDLKPEKIFIDNTFRPVISGFAYSKKIRNVAETQVGTPVYLSPEIQQGLPYTVKVDVYTTGIIFFEILNVASYSLSDNPIEDIHEYCTNGEIMFSEEKFIYCNYFNNLVLSMVDQKPENRPAMIDVQNKMEEIMNRMLTETIHNLEAFKINIANLGLTDDLYWAALVKNQVVRKAVI